ncbi:hypothetical protein QTO34_008140 [Cnephaeus nilssonii]|uniref:Uncharacterized protein n=1 Tax=Cnephaeus nilssonii TaxID=3371016 RepID=A0AA40LTJ2_CNENI|nr:hypothetical protein QTO34_008140 [Eptesicus nilssonii]
MTMVPKVNPFSGDWTCRTIEGCLLERRPGLDRSKCSHRMKMVISAVNPLIHMSPCTTKSCTFSTLLLEPSLYCYSVSAKLSTAVASVLSNLLAPVCSLLKESVPGLHQGTLQGLFPGEKAQAVIHLLQDESKAHAEEELGPCPSLKLRGFRLGKGFPPPPQHLRSQAHPFPNLKPLPDGRLGVTWVPRRFPGPRPFKSLWRTAMAQTLSLRCRWLCELSVPPAQSATLATPSPAPCASRWPNRGRSGVMETKKPLPHDPRPQPAEASHSPVPVLGETEMAPVTEAGSPRRQEAACPVIPGRSQQQKPHISCPTSWGIPGHSQPEKLPTLHLREDREAARLRARSQHLWLATAW